LSKNINIVGLGFSVCEIIIEIIEVKKCVYSAIARNKLKNEETYGLTKEITLK